MRYMIGLGLFVAMVMADGEDQFADDPHGRYGDGLKKFSYGVVAPYRNDLRQHALNAVARRLGAGVGTADVDGVAGTPTGRGPYPGPYYHGGWYFGNPWYQYGYYHAHPYGYPWYRY